MVRGPKSERAWPVGEWPLDNYYGAMISAAFRPRNYSSTFTTGSCVIWEHLDISKAVLKIVSTMVLAVYMDPILYRSTVCLPPDSTREASR